MDIFDIIKKEIPSENLKFRIEKIDDEKVQIYLSKGNMYLLYQPILNMLSNKENHTFISEKDGYICLTIDFANVDESVKFINDYLAQSTTGASNLAIIDNKTGDIICAGIASACKHTDPVHKDLLLLSLDGKHYFNMDNKSTYHFEWYDGKPVDFINSHNYTIKPWKESQNYDPSTIDVYIDHSYDEIDVEVRPLVDAMNTIPAIYTTGSCCGHGQDHLYVSFTTASILSLNILVDAIVAANIECNNEFYLNIPVEYDVKYNSPLKRKFILDGKDIKIKSVLNEIPSDSVISMTLFSKNKNVEVYGAAKILTEKIINMRGVHNGYE